MASPVLQTQLFSSLPKWKAPWYEFFFSYGTQAIIVAVFVWVPIFHPEVLDPPTRDYHAIQLVPTPEPVNHEPQRQLPPPVMVARLDPAPDALRLPAPLPKPKAADSPAPEVKVAEKKIAPVLPTPPPAIPKPPVQTNVFSTGSSAPQTIEKPAAKVQTGGFGDPNGVSAKLNTGKSPVNIASLGSFDLPAGPGYGNGSGGAKGVRGVVASTGFGSGIATGDPHAVRGTVHEAGFGNADVPASSAVRSHAGTAAPRMTAAEILSKPTPVYTPEARAKHIEGEVLLEVVFEASGKIRVLRVIRGLGYGLDDAAVRAAEQIRFKPALQDGQPSDSTAVLHIVFQLA
jgi:TonB family protein